jgi:hypothetical protein
VNGYDKFARFHVGSVDPGGGAVGTSIDFVNVRWRRNELAAIHVYDKDLQHFAARHSIAMFDFASMEPSKPNSLFDHTVTSETLERFVLQGLREAAVKEAIKSLILSRQSSGQASGFAWVALSAGAGSGRLRAGINVSVNAGVWSGRAASFYPASGTTNVSTPKIAAIKALIGK